MPAIPTEIQRSAGGVAFRRHEGRTEIAAILVGPKRRWQLPKGIVDAGESAEVAAVREVREEAGIDVELIAPLETVEYWYVATRGSSRVRYHKFVHFFLMRYVGGDVGDHDHEVIEARWIEIGDAPSMLDFESERRVVGEAAALIEPT